MLNKLIKVSSVSGAFIVFCGVLKLMFFYSAFKIDIVDFLNFPEIITSFLDDINILLIFATIMIFLSLVVVSVASKTHEVKIEDYLETLLKHIYPYKKGYLIFFGIIITTLWTVTYFDILNFSYSIIYVIVFCCIQFSTYLVMRKDDNGEIEIPKSPIVITITISIIVAIYLLAQHDIELALNNNHNVKLTTKSSIIECNKSTKNIYLGKTDNYVFIKIYSSNSSIAIPTSEINKYEFE